MQQIKAPKSRMAAVLCLLGSVAVGSVCAQTEGELTAKVRLFPALGPGLRTVRRGADGRTYALASPSPGLLAFDKQGKQVLAIEEAVAAGSSNPKSGRVAITFAEDCDVEMRSRFLLRTAHGCDRFPWPRRIRSPRSGKVRSL
jgi:hypothetical protein